MKVSIDAGGRKVELECSDANVTVDSIGATALELWQATAGSVQPSEGSAFGLSAQLSGGAPNEFGMNHYGRPSAPKAPR